MNHLIDRYVYDVVRRLPEKDRDEVSKELKANLYDMLSENADENELKTVLYELGTPASLAEKYRQNPRYLISPAVYDDYIRVLKFLLPLVGTVVLAIGMIWGAIDAIKDGLADIAYVVSNALSTGINFGLSAVLQSLLWTTVGFVIAERTGASTGANKGQEWKIEDLPEVHPNDKSRIPLSDSIVELVMSVVFAAAAILLCTGIFPVSFIFIKGDTEIRTLFSSGFLTACIPAVAVMTILVICACAAKIKLRRWTPLVCGAVVVSNLVNMSVMLYLINRSDLFSAEFMNFLHSIDWDSFDLLRIMGTGGINPGILFISVGIVACSLAGCCIAVYKTLKYRY